MDREDGNAILAGGCMAGRPNPVVLCGGVAVVAAGAIFVISGSHAPPKGTCELGSTGVSLVVAGLQHGENAKTIAGALSGLGANTACEAAVSGLKQDPTQPVNVSIGGTPQNVTAYQLQQMIDQASRRHSLACLGAYGFGTQNDLACIRYQITP